MPLFHMSMFRAPLTLTKEELSGKAMRSLMDMIIKSSATGKVHLLRRCQAARMSVLELCFYGFSIGLWTICRGTLSCWMNPTCTLFKKLSWLWNLNGRFRWKCLRFGSKKTRPSIFESLATACDMWVRAERAGKKKDAQPGNKNRCSVGCCKRYKPRVQPTN